MVDFNALRKRHASHTLLRRFEDAAWDFAHLGAADKEEWEGIIEQYNVRRQEVATALGLGRLKRATHPALEAGSIDPDPDPEEGT